ncbi:efflux RND transporter periplasmic adaptor subunit [Clostridium guangxiense]|uniref:efflux RND transporter periplasmic adaptor subunit n=1 Tax=Clostridium guangxiense TaxID=1662055 RepID=UPI001E62AC10|nr:efflux RND transporter periplasmic adaptor subunit [Clostridium guangxiense]MCD2348731.1 efflux RND transporter periplasmic adaptor subunit [Clostridium guangxiense]
MKSKVIKVVSVVAAVCLLGGGGYYFYNKSAKAKAASNTTRYYTVTAQRSNIDVTVSATGTVEATQTKDVVANNSGTVQNLGVNVGDTVSQGSTIAKVQSDDIDAAVSKANLTVQQQQLQVNNAKNANDEAMQELSLQSAQSDLNNKIEQQNKMTLTAPIGGVVVAKNDNNGDSVQAGKALITIADLSSMKVDVQVDELDISKVKVGQTADIKFDAISGKSYTGTVDSISQMGTTSNNVTTYDVIVTINNPDGVKIGMNANVNIKVTSKSDALAIPVEALIERNNKKYVMLKTNSSSTTSQQGSWSKSNNSGNNSYKRSSSNGSFGGNSSGRISTLGGKLVEVETGLENETTVEITSGIKEGDQVMIQLPQSTSTNSQRSSSGFGSFGGLGGGSRQSGSSSKNNEDNSNSSSNNNSSNNNSSGNNGSGNSGSGK